MKTLLVAAGAAAILLPVPVLAQAMDHSMHGMKMPAKPAAKPKPKPVAKKAKSPARAMPAAPRTETPISPPVVFIPPIEAPAPALVPAELPEQDAPVDHSTMDHGAMNHAPGSAGAMQGGMMMGMGGTDYAEGSGTSRLPAREGMMRGVHVMTGDWMLRRTAMPGDHIPTRAGRAARTRRSSSRWRWLPRNGRWAMACT